MQNLYGLTGNNNIGNYKAIQTFSAPTGVVFGSGSTVSSAYYPGGPTDQSLGWESTSQYNVGIDLGLFHDRLSVIANYYDSRTYNLLIGEERRVAARTVASGGREGGAPRPTREEACCREEISIPWSIKAEADRAGYHKVADSCIRSVADNDRRACCSGCRSRSRCRCRD